MSKKKILTFGLAAGLTLAGAEKVDAQVNNTTEGVQHNIENVFKYQQNVDSKNTITFAEAQNLSQDTIKIQDIKDLLKDKEFVQNLTNVECIKEILKEYNLDENYVKMSVEYILNSDNEEAQNLSQDTIKIQEIKDILNNKGLAHKMANDEGIKALFNEYNLNEADIEKVIQDILNSDFTIGIITKSLEYNKERNIGGGIAVLACIILWVAALILVPKKQNGTLSRRARTHIK